MDRPIGGCSSIAAGIVVGFGASILQTLYAFYCVVYSEGNFVAQLFFPGSILLWAVVFIFVGSFVGKRQGSGALAGLCAGLSGGIFSSVGLLIIFQAVFRTTFFICGPLIFIVLPIFTVLGTFFGFLGGSQK